MDGGRGSSRPLLRRELRGAALYAARGIAILSAVLALIAYVRWLPRSLAMRLDLAAQSQALTGDDGPFEVLTWIAALLGIGSALVWCAVGSLIAWKRSRDLFGLLLFLGFVSIGLVVTADPVVVLSMQRTDTWAPFQTSVLHVANGLVLLWAFVFPDGRFVPRLAVLPAAIWMAWSLLRIATPAADQARLGLPGVLAYSSLIIFALGAQVYRYFCRSSAVQRQQLKWFLLGALVGVLAYLVTIPIQLLVPELQRPGPAFGFRTVSSMLFSVSSIAIPLAVAVAIFRQGLLDIDLIVNRTVTYAVLTAILVAGFVLISSVADRVLQAVIGQRSELVPVVTTLLLAVLYVPLRNVLIAFADRLLSGRRVMTLLFVDIASSTETAVRLGDHTWRERLELFRTIVRRELRRHGGDEVDTAGDGFFVTFEGPGRAIRCAYEIVKAVALIGLQVRAGVHIGEIEIYHGRLSGVEVHAAARLVALAQPGEVLVSGTLRDVVAGSNIGFSDRGEHALRGIPGTSRVYAVVGA